MPLKWGMSVRFESRSTVTKHSLWRESGQISCPVRPASGSGARTGPPGRSRGASVGKPCAIRECAPPCGSPRFCMLACPAWSSSSALAPRQSPRRIGTADAFTAVRERAYRIRKTSFPPTMVRRSLIFAMSRGAIPKRSRSRMIMSASLPTSRDPV